MYTAYGTRYVPARTMIVLVWGVKRERELPQSDSVSDCSGRRLCASPILSAGRLTPILSRGFSVGTVHAVGAV